MWSSSIRLLKLVQNPIIKHHRCVSQFKPSNKIHIQTNYLRDRIEENRIFTNAEWHQIREHVLQTDRQINEINIDALTLGYCLPNVQLPVAKSYVQFLRSKNIEPNFATVGRLLRLYYIAATNNGHSISNDESNEIIELYNLLLVKTKNFDATTSENIIHGLCLTNQWKQSIDLLDSINLTAKPSASAYSAIVSKAFLAGEIELGWRLLEECVVKDDKIPKCEVFLAYFQKCIPINLSPVTKQQSILDITKMLEFIGKNGLIVSRDVVLSLKSLINSLGQFHCQFVNIEQNGKCFSCQLKLKTVFLSKDEFKQLSQRFLEKVLIRKDAFLKSSPKEVAKFQNFLQTNQPFDCIIDGLNVAFSAGIKKSPAQFSKLLSSTVNYFYERNQRVLVLGRKHMLRWPKPQMNNIQTRAKLFLTEDLSQDDPFLLYAALHSGPNTNFVSRDLMRSHAYLLGDDLKPIFRRWQQEHQYILDSCSNSFAQKVRIKEPIKYETVAHSCSDRQQWHIPFREEYTAIPADSFELPKSWLCLNLTE